MTNETLLRLRLDQIETAYARQTTVLNALRGENRALRERLGRLGVDIVPIPELPTTRLEPADSPIPQGYKEL